MVRASAMVLDGYGINCPYETAYAVRASGGEAKIVHVGELIASPKILEEYNLLLRACRKSPWPRDLVLPAKV